MSIENIILHSAPLYANANADNCELETECLYGEQFKVLKHAGEYAFGTLLTDGYEGWVPLAALGQLPISTHRLTVPASWVRSSASIKSQSLLPLSMGSVVHATQLDTTESCYCVVLAGGKQGYIPVAHICSIEIRQSDWVAAAEAFLNVPYRWGGRTSAGLDCSALVQLAAQTAQIALPRNSSQQQLQGSRIDNIELLQRGDLVFWHGHVGIMQSGTQLLHANAFHMQVASEPLQDAVDRILLKDGPITAMKRLDHA